MALFDTFGTDTATAEDTNNFGAASTGYSNLPTYMRAADNHNIMQSGGEFSFSDPSTWYTGLSNVTKFATASVVSGAAQLYNTAVATGNFFGGDFEEARTDQLMASIDSDLGTFYAQHQQGVDLAGFVVGSFVPGGLAIKAARAAARTGMVGSNIAKATGLLETEAENLIFTAGKELANRQAAFSVFDKGVVQAFSYGVRGAITESVIAEAAVAATMYKSPVLSDMDLTDIGTNIFWGGVLGGAIGGAFNAARVYGGVKKIVSKADSGPESLKAITLETAMPKSASEADNIIVRARDAERFATATVDDSVLTADTIARTRASSIEDAWLKNRLSLQNMSGGDADLANTLADNFHGLSSTKHMYSLYGAKEVGRVGKTLKGEVAARADAKQSLLDMATGSTPTPPTADIKVGYVRLFGEGAGDTSWDAPIVTRLADKVASAQQVAQRVRSYGFKPAQALDTRDVIKADAHYIWAAENAKYKAEMVVDRSSIPMLTALESKLPTGPEAAIKLYVKNDKGQKSLVTSREQLTAIRMQTQEQTALKLLEKGRPVEEVASITNLSPNLLIGLRNNVRGEAAEYNMRAAANKSYTDMLRQKGLHTSDTDIDISTRPQWAKVSYDIKNTAIPSSFELDAMSLAAAKWNTYQQGIDRAVASVVGETLPLERFVRMTDDEVLRATRFDSTAGYFSSTNAGYDSLGSKAQYLGRLAQDFTDVQKQATDTVMTASMQRLQANPAAAFEFNAVNKLVSQSPEPYVLNRDGGFLEPLSIKRWRDNGELGEPPVLPEGVREAIYINDNAAYDAIKAHIERNGKRNGDEITIRNAQGLENSKSRDPDIFYPVRKDYRDFKHFAFVVDPTVRGTGHVSMIHAVDEQQLASLISKVPEGFRVVTDRKSKLFHKAMGDYDYERTLHDNYIDVSLKRAGVDSDYALETDPQLIVNKILSQHYRQDAVLARETIRAYNEKAFTALEQLGDRYTEVATSRLGGAGKSIEQTVENPYTNYIKTALNISSVGEHALITGFNTAMDKVFSGVVSTLRNAFVGVKNVQDVEQLNAILKQHGLGGGYTSAMDAAYANITSDRGALSRFVQRANSMVSTLVLGTDPFNAIANAVGNNVLLGTELNNLTKAIKSGNTAVAGRLSQLGGVTIPGSGGQQMFSPAKMIARAHADWIGPDKKDLVTAMNDLGYNPSFRQQVHNMHQDLVITGAENARSLANKEASAFDKFADIGMSASGVRYSEEYARFVSVHVAKQITDLAEQAGIYTRAESLATINTFVNRVQGNILASQRPLVMQGPVGMAIGLFQTYQFNLLQQMFRTVAEGSNKDALMLLGLQGSIFGMNGLPAFNFINTHIVGTASGNSEHRDFYNATYGTLGNEIGDWLMFGIASNLPKAANLLPFVENVPGVNLYTRGDINPRQVTVLPSALPEIPLVRAGVSLWNTLAGSVAQIGAGAPAVEAVLQGIEHNGLSRPLAGLAQVAQGLTGNGTAYATDGAGTLRGSNDLLSVTSLIRVAGGRPMDESISTNFYYNLKAYQAKDREKMDVLRKAVKQSVIQGGVLEEEQYGKFAEEYMKAGGKSKNFNKWVMEQYTAANTPAAEKLAGQLSNPYSQRMQEFLRGRQITAADLSPGAFQPE